MGVSKMNKLNELIQTLCPDGVEYKKLGEIAAISRGGNFQKKDYVEAGIPCIHYGQIYTRYGLFVDRTISYISEEKAQKQKMAVKNDIIMAVTSENIDDVCKCIAWLGEEEVAVSGHTAIIHHTINPKYLVYYLHSSMFHKQKTKLAHGTKVIEVTPDKLLDVVLPVPPMEIQSAIVCVLDEFSEYMANLMSELAAERNARKKQYEYYREKMLTFDESVLRLPLGTLFDVRNGYTPSKANSDFWEGGTIPWFRMEDIRKNGRVLFDALQHVTTAAVKRGKLFPVNSLIISTTATIGEHALLKTAGLTNQQITNCAIKNEYVDKIIPEFAFYYFFKLGEWCKEHINQGGGLAIIGTEKIKQFEFPVPPIKEQERIVAILEQLDALYNDLSNDISAEIEQRQQQYEHYLDTLLTFKQRS